MRFELELLQIFTHVAQGGAQSRGTTAFMNSFTPIADDALASPLNFPEGCFIFYAMSELPFESPSPASSLSLRTKG